MASKRPLTEYGKAVKTELLIRDMTVTRLAELVREDTGMFCSQSYLWMIFTGQRRPERIVNSVNKILQLDRIT